MPDDTPSEPRRIIADLRRELAQAKAERDEALAQQQALAEVLAVINASPGDLAPVFEAMLDKAVRLCETAFGVLYIYDGEKFQTGAAQGPAALLEFMAERGPMVPASGSGLDRFLSGDDVVCEADIAASELYREHAAGRSAYVELGGA